MYRMVLCPFPRAGPPPAHKPDVSSRQHILRPTSAPPCAVLCMYRCAMGVVDLPRSSRTLSPLPPIGLCLLRRAAAGNSLTNPFRFRWDLAGAVLFPFWLCGQTAPLFLFSLPSLRFFPATCHLLMRTLKKCWFFSRPA